MNVFKKNNEDVRHEEKNDTSKFNYSQPTIQSKPSNSVEYVNSTPVYINPQNDDIDQICTRESSDYFDDSTFPSSPQTRKYPIEQIAHDLPRNDVKYYYKSSYETTGVIIFVVENTIVTNMYREEILRLINKIISDNETSLFIFIGLANIFKLSKLLCFDNLRKINIDASLFSLDNVISTCYNMDNVLSHISNFIRDELVVNKTVLLNGKKYNITDARIIFIGNGEKIVKTQFSSIILNSLYNNKKVKAIKYFCINDTDTINIASMGFRVIGHIESNFYQ